MGRKIILADDYRNETLLDDPAGLTTPRVGWDAGNNRPVWQEEGGGGGGGGLTFVPEAAVELLNTTTAVSVARTALASGAANGAVAVVLELWISTTAANNGNVMAVYHSTGGAGLHAGLIRPGGVANFLVQGQVIVGLDASEQFDYAVTRAAGTIAYRIYRVGYWI